jgi:hypothetical protein
MPLADVSARRQCSFKETCAHGLCRDGPQLLPADLRSIIVMVPWSEAMTTKEPRKTAYLSPRRTFGIQHLRLAKMCWCVW